MKIFVAAAFLFVSVAPLAEAQILRAYSAESLIKARLAADESFWVNPLGPLSHTKGVTGAYGPLGNLGPFGENLWNATAAFRVVGNWEDLAKDLSQMNGPLSAAGPVFLTTELGQAMVNFNGAAHLLAPGGVLHALGNAGPLGPLGVAGVLGPNGAHGLGRNAVGDYVDKNRTVIRSVRIDSHEGPKHFDLYELYKLDKLRSGVVLDTSFAVRGTIDRGQSISFRVASKREQWVNFLAVNEYELDSFSVTVRDEAGGELSSAAESLSNFVSVKVRAGTRLHVTLAHKSSLHYLRKPFRIYVTGSEGTREVSRPFHYTRGR
jgi:hypothetical protein